MVRGTACLLFLVLVVCSGVSTAAVHSLADDWSNTQNPSGPWQFNYGSDVLPFYQQNWSGFPIDGWTTTSTGIVPPAWLQAQSAWEGVAEGDILVHSSNPGYPLASVTWTSPLDGLITISGQAWDAWHTGVRDDSWALYLNGTQIAHADSITGVAKGSLSADFAQNVDLGHSLSNLKVAIGDVLMFQVAAAPDPSFSQGMFTGVELSVATVPEPMAIWSGISLLGAMFCFRRHRLHVARTGAEPR